MQSHRRVPVFLFASLRLATGQVPPPLVPDVQQRTEVCEGGGIGGTCGGGALTDVYGKPIEAGKQCATCGQQVVQTYQPPPTVTYQQQPPQVYQQQQPPQTTYQRSWQYVPGQPVAPPNIDPPRQPPMFNLLRKVSYEPFIKVFEHEIPYIHYESIEKREECNIKETPIPIFKPEAKNIVYIREEHRTKKALRLVQHFPEPVIVNVPMYLGTIDETSQTAHHRVWYDLPVEVTRVPPEMKIELPQIEKTPGHYVPVTRRVTVQPPPVPVTVQPPPVPVTVQSPPVQLVAQVDEQISCGQGTCIGRSGSEYGAIASGTDGAETYVTGGTGSVGGTPYTYTTGGAQGANIAGNSNTYTYTPGGAAGTYPTGTCGA